MNYDKKLNLFIYICALFAFLIKADAATMWQQSPYFTTSFLRDYDAVHEALVHDGFIPDVITTDDGHRLACLWLARPHARYTVIFCTGFWPGRKEGLASFYPLLPPDANILFFDARGHGKSSGSLLYIMLMYGAQEYRDIISAIQYAHHKTSVPIIVHGTCAGAFHAAHAIFELQCRQLLESYDVRGLVFDSGWDDLWTVTRSALFCECAARLKMDPAFSSSCSSSSGLYVLRMATTLSHMLLTPLYMATPHRKPLNTIIPYLQTPIFYIHMKNDCYADSWPIQKLAAKTPQGSTWWITSPSKHACHHLKYKDEYRSKMIAFIEKVL